MSADTTHREALMRLGASTAEAVAQVLEAFAPEGVTRHEVTVSLDPGVGPFADTEPGTVAAGVSYIDGVTGANVFLAPVRTARTLAARMGLPHEQSEDPLTELELSAISEAANQMMAAAAGAIGMVLGQEIEISVPTARAIADAEEADKLFGSAPYTATSTFTIDGESCRLVQLVPSAFVLRVSQALDEVEATPPGVTRPAAGTGARREGSDLTQTLGRVGLRVWAEVGRTRLPMADTLALPVGAVLELDRAVDAPIDLYVNGLHFAVGHLMTDDDGHWRVEIDEIDRLTPTDVSEAALAAPR